MFWWTVILSGIVAALAYAYWEHGKQSRRLADLFTAIATAHGGEVKAATVLALPQLRFGRDGRRYFVGAMASGGPLVSGTASRPGFRGPFTFADLELPFDTGQELRVQRMDNLDRSANRLLRSIAAGHRQSSGDDVFDHAFGIQSNEQAFVRRVLDPALRRKLLDSSQQRLEVAVTGAKISVHIDDYVKSAAELDEMIEIAALLADNCAAP
jgi:hypothetical protein